MSVLAGCHEFSESRKNPKDVLFKRGVGQAGVSARVGSGSAFSIVRGSSAGSVASASQSSCVGSVKRQRSVASWLRNVASAYGSIPHDPKSVLVGALHKSRRAAAAAMVQRIAARLAGRPPVGARSMSSVSSSCAGLRLVASASGTVASASVELSKRGVVSGSVGARSSLSQGLKSRMSHMSRSSELQASSLRLVASVSVVSASGSVASESGSVASVEQASRSVASASVGEWRSVGEASSSVLMRVAGKVEASTKSAVEMSKRVH